MTNGRSSRIARGLLTLDGSRIGRRLLISGPNLVPAQDPPNRPDITGQRPLMLIEERLDAVSKDVEFLHHRFLPIGDRRIVAMKDQVHAHRTSDPAPGKSVTMFLQVSFHCFRIPFPDLREMSDHPRPDLKMTLVVIFPDVVASQHPPTERPEG
jgi:hypothetical protein